MKDDKEIVLEAVRPNGYALRYASERLKDDEEIVLEAVRQDGYALAFAWDTFGHASKRIREEYKNLEHFLDKKAGENIKG